MAEAHVCNGDFMDARAFAYVYLHDPMHVPHMFIHRTMEQACGAPAFQLAALARGVGLMRFNSPGEREAIIAMSPVTFEGNLLTIERHEEVDNRFYAFYRVYAEIAVWTTCWSTGRRSQRVRSCPPWAMCAALTQRTLAVATSPPSVLCFTLIIIETY
jgi:hypothetical protein